MKKRKKKKKRRKTSTLRWVRFSAVARRLGIMDLEVEKGFRTDA